MLKKIAKKLQKTSRTAALASATFIPVGATSSVGAGLAAIVFSAVAFRANASIANPFTPSQLEGGTRLPSTTVAGGENTPVATRANVNQTLQDVIDGNLVIDSANQGRFDLRVIFANTPNASGVLPSQSLFSFFSDSNNHITAGLMGSEAAVSASSSSLSTIASNVAITSGGRVINVHAAVINQENIESGEIRTPFDFLDIINTFAGASGNVTVAINSNTNSNPFGLIASSTLNIDGDTGAGIQVFAEGGATFSTTIGNLATRLELVETVPEPTSSSLINPTPFVFPVISRFSAPPPRAKIARFRLVPFKTLQSLTA